jgi:methyl-accepting chemotaxis protein
MWIWTKTISGKLLQINVAAVLSLALTVTIAQYSGAKLEAALKTAYEDRIPRIVLMGNLESSINALTEWLFVAVTEQDEAKRKQYITAATEAADSIKDLAQEYIEQKKNETAQKIVDDFLAPHLPKAIASAHEVIRLLAETNEIQAISKRVEIHHELTEVYLPEANQLTAGMAKIKKNSMTTNQNLQTNVMAEAQYFSRMQMIAGIIFTIVNFAFSLLIARWISKSLRTTASRLAQGSNSIESSVSQLVRSSGDIETSASRQASALHETASAMEEIKAMTTKSLQNAENASNLSARSRDEAQTGKSVMDEMMAAMAKISESNNSVREEVRISNQNVTNIANIIQDITAKTKIINDIVFQTKLLSFNASVEAARAGEAGKGFSVVAQEIGKLAEMSGIAAEEISVMLDSSASKVRSVVEETTTKVNFVVDDAKDKVLRGNQIAIECKRVLDDILGSASDASRMSLEIVSASKEQMHGISEIANAISELNLANESNTKAAEDSSTEVSSLATQATTVKQSSAQLLKLVSGQPLLDTDDLSSASVPLDQAG